MTNRSDRIKAHLIEAKAKAAYNPAGVFSNEFGPVPPSMRRSSTGIANKWKITVKDHDGDPQHMVVNGETEGIARASFRSGIHPLAQFKIHKVEPIHEDAAGDVLRATVAKHKLKDMEGTKKSQALIDKLTKRVAAGKRHMTEEAIKKAVKPTPKPTKILTNNPGYGYHGIAHTKHKGDTNKAHAEYNRMHAKVKDWAGEAGHLMNAKKPNLMVRDYLDSSRGRHLEGLQADEKYIKKDFGHFARSYDPKLFVESLEEGKATHGVFTVWHSGDYKGMVIHHGGNSSNVARVEALAAKLNGQVEDFNKRSKEKSNYHHEVRPLGRKPVNEAKSAYSREYDADRKERNVKTYDEFTKRAHDFAKQRSKQKVDIDFEPRDNTTVSWAKPKGSPHKVMLGIFRHSVADHNKGTGHHILPKHKAVAAGDFSGRDLFEETQPAPTEGDKARWKADTAYFKFNKPSGGRSGSGWKSVSHMVQDRSQPGHYHVHLKDGRVAHTSADHSLKNKAGWPISKYHASVLGKDGHVNLKEETLNETTRSQDAQRVQYGVMKRDDYLRKWKIGKFGEKKNSLAGPGGLYKNLLVGSNIDNKSAATKK